MRETASGSTRHPLRVRSIVVVGVSGSGKSTIGRLLAANIESEFCDGDDLHPRENVDLMAAGHPLGDLQRLPWLQIVGQRLKSTRAEGRSLVMACSALKHSYRDILRDHVADIFFVHLEGPMQIVQGRIEVRQHEFMPISLLTSQYEILEPLGEDEIGVRADIRQSPDQILTQVIDALRSSPKPASP